MFFCKHSAIFGLPKTGVHSYRMVGDTAAVDYFGTIGLAMLLTWTTNIPLDIATIVMFVASILLHALFCVPTNATRWMFS